MMSESTPASLTELKLVWILSSKKERLKCGGERHSAVETFQVFKSKHDCCCCLVKLVEMLCNVRHLRDNNFASHSHHSTAQAHFHHTFRVFLFLAYVIISLKSQGRQFH